LAVLFGLTLAAGCTKPALREKPPPDPLLTSKKPIEGKVSISDVRPAPPEDYSPPPRPRDEDEIRPVQLLGVRRVHDEQR